MSWKLETLELPLRYTWAISRNASVAKTNFVVHCQLNGQQGLGEVAPNIRYGESPDSIREAFYRLQENILVLPQDIESLTTALDSLILPSALRFGVESAWVHAFCKAHNTDVNSWLGLPAPGSYATSFSLPIMPSEEVADFYAREGLQRFRWLKLKVNRQDGLQLLEALRKAAPNQPILVDANESYADPDEALRDAAKMKALGVTHLEQPLPAAMGDAYRYMKPLSPLPLVGDESMTEHADLEDLAGQFNALNMKLMKAGGYLNGLRQLKKIHQLGLQPMIGCMIESGLGISSALRLAGLAELVDLDGFLILKNDPYPQVKENDGRLSLL